MSKFILKVYEFFTGTVHHIGAGDYGIENEQGIPLVQVRFDDKRKRVVLIFR